MSEYMENLTGYPSIDKPWLKYYKEGIENLTIPSKTMYRFIYENHMGRLGSVAINYYSRNITYGEFFENIMKNAHALSSHGISEGDIVTIISLNTPEILYCIYALNYLGAVANLLLATMTEQEIVQNLKETSSKMVFILDKILDKVGVLKCNVPVVVLPVARSMGELINY